MMKIFLNRAFLMVLLLASSTAAHAAAYRLTTGSYIIREADGAAIPSDPLNVDWQKYQAWLAAGNTPDAAPAPPAAPTCNITSTGTPGETGNYAVPDTTQMTEIASASLYTQINSGKFPGGVTSFLWLDATGTPHTFSSSAAWLTWASAMADCVASYTRGGTSFSETIP
jgi:hypothetical protein